MKRSRVRAQAAHHAGGSGRRRPSVAGSVRSIAPPPSGIDFVDRPNGTGIPAALRLGLEHLSGMDFSDVRVHRNSPEPSKFTALAYTAGRDIHLGPGQERHLAHEGWHVAQQLQGRVRPATRGVGATISADDRLEQEADTMGALALRPPTTAPISHQVVRPGAQIAPPAIQLMDDPDGLVLKSLRAAFVTLFQKYKKLSSIPKPSDVKGDLADIVTNAEDNADAYKRFATLILQYFEGDSVFLGQLENEFVQACVAAERATVRDEQRRREELTSLRELEKPASSSSVKKRRAPGAEVPTYSAEQKKRLREKLDQPGFKKKMFQASELAYQQHRSRARPTVAKRATLNELAELGALSRSDLAEVQASYLRGKMGDSLLLESGEGYQVTMTRGGGQEVGQLGPYKRGGRAQSVEEIIEEILRNTDLNSMELGKALHIRDPADLARYVKGKKVSDKYFEKIRALRQLIAIEMDRGFELSLATSLEARSIMHGFRHAEEYAEETPMAPVKATTDIRKARKKRKTSEKSDESPPTVEHIPGYLQQRATRSTSHFLQSFVENPRADREAERLVSAVLAEEEEGGPSELLVDASTDVLRTPEHISAAYEEEGEVSLDLGLDDPYGSLLGSSLSLGPMATLEDEPALTLGSVAPRAVPTFLREPFVSTDLDINRTVDEWPGVDRVRESYDLTYISGQGWLCYIRCILMGIGEGPDALANLYNYLLDHENIDLSAIAGVGVETGSDREAAILRGVQAVTETAVLPIIVRSRKDQDPLVAGTGLGGEGGRRVHLLHTHLHFTLATPHT